MEKTIKLTKETFSPDNFTFVDLGLPSGRQWVSENAPGHYDFDEASEVFGELLPKGSAMAELIEECQVEWNPTKKGLDITGPNGNSIFLPAAGYASTRNSEPRFVGSEGDYWTRMVYVPKSESYAPGSQTYARNLYFNSGYVSPLNNYYRSGGFSVRPCREF
jgi:hypothetical protein